METIQIFSPSELNETAFKELLPQLFEQLYFDYQIIKENFEVLNYFEIRRLTHKIKGTAASYSAPLLFTKSKSLQETLDSKNINIIEAKIKELGEAINISHSFANSYLTI